jgi:hypothetical protein
MGVNGLGRGGRVDGTPVTGRRSPGGRAEMKLIRAIRRGRRGGGGGAVDAGTYAGVEAGMRSAPKSGGGADVVVPRRREAQVV